MLHSNHQPRLSRYARRAALAAPLATVVWKSNGRAEDTVPLALQLLPPLPIQVGQIEVSTSQRFLRSGPTQNPFCKLDAPSISLVSGEQSSAGLQPTADVLSLQPVSEAIDESLDAAEDVVELVRPKTTLRLTPLGPAAEPPTTSEAAVADEVVTVAGVPAETSEPITFSIGDGPVALSFSDSVETEDQLPEPELVKPPAAIPIEVSLADETATSVERKPLEHDSESQQIQAELSIPEAPVHTNEFAAMPDAPVIRRKREVQRGTFVPSNAIQPSPIIVGPVAAPGASSESDDAPSGVVIDVPTGMDMLLRNAAAVEPVAGAVEPVAGAVASVAGAGESGQSRQETLFDSARVQGASIDVGKAKVQSFHVQGNIRSYAIEDESICQVLPAGSSELRIIGQQGGQTRLAVWLGTEEDTRPIVYQVCVGSKSEAVLQGLIGTARKLTSTLTTMFPDCKVQVIAEADQLMVHGTAMDEEQARRILQLVRQTCLVPVIDHVTTR